MNLLGPVLTEENVEELVERAAFLSKVETQRLVAAVRESEAEESGLSDVAVPPPGPQTLSLLAAMGAVADPAHAPAPGSTSGSAAPGTATPAAGAPREDTRVVAPPAAVSRSASAAPAPRTELRPVGKDAWSLRVTLDDAARAELLDLAALTAHSTRGDLAKVLRDAVRGALAKHRKRRGASRSERKQNSAPAKPASGAAAPSSADAWGDVRADEAAAPATPAPSAAFSPDAPGVLPANEPTASSGDGGERRDPRAVPMPVREAVWERDGGRCAWVSPEGKRCGSTWKLELGHVRAVALGGQATVEDLRLECATHNQYEAMRVFGRRHMSRFQPSLDSRRWK